MKMKLSPLIPAASGKIGGHSISNTRNGIVMKTIKQPRRQASHLQSVQRFVTADITNKWQFLTPGQHAAWNHTASNYPYINNLGEPATRNGFQTFCFLNQNRRILDLDLLQDPPIFESIQKPFIFREPSADDFLILKGLNLKSRYLYAVYVQIHYSVGSSTHEQTPLIVAVLTDTQLTAGYDLVPAIKSTYATGTRIFRVNVETVAIDKTSGNRDMTPRNFAVTIPSLSLNFDILSYYPFTANADDHFNINNGTSQNVTFSSGGFVNGQAIFPDGYVNFINLGNDPSLNFVKDGVTGPYTIICWYKRTSNNSPYIFTKLHPIEARPEQQLFTQHQNTYFRTLCFSGPPAQRSSLSPRSISNLNEWIFLAWVYESELRRHICINETFSTVNGGQGGYVGQGVFDNNFLIGKHPTVNSNTLQGAVSEFTLVNGALSYEDLITIKNANENGLTILDLI